MLVTGASSGIGRAICSRLLSTGCIVIGLARDFSKFPCEDTRFHPFPVDLADLDGLPDRLQAVVEAYPDIDGIVCCAGRGRFGSLEEFSYAQIRALMDLNFTSQAYVARAFLPALKKRGAGHVIFIGSEAALMGARRGAIYCASKFALRGMAQALRGECARRGVRVCIINPGMVRTGFFDDLDFSPGVEEAEYLLPEDIAEAVMLVIGARGGTVYDEIDLTPLKRVWRTK